MKYIAIYLFAFLVALAFSACEQKMEVYNAPGNDRLNFAYEDMADSVLSYTFIYCPAEQMTDTIWLEVSTVGYVTDVPRPVALRQIMTGQDDAV
ncbi:MAG: DUF4843 domain-containing protein, partial [Odoribacter sp.]|nr:DUF4843 domain-containing protein [Odoribacter sp.]